MNSARSRLLQRGAEPRESRKDVVRSSPETKTRGRVFYHVFTHFSPLLTNFFDVYVAFLTHVLARRSKSAARP